MQVIKPGPRTRKPARKPATVTVKDETDQEHVDVPAVVTEIALPRTITVKNKSHLQQIVPGHVWRCAPFPWDPQPFGVESDRLHDRVVEARTQNNSLLSFLKNPRKRLVYGVAGNPDDQKAKLFAAFLVNAHVQALGLGANVLWHTVYDGYENKLLKEYDPIDGKPSPSLLVLSNITPNASSVRLGKVRDLLERFDNIPRIVITAGEDPLSFFTTRLFYQLNALAYFSESLIKKKIEII